MYVQIVHVNSENYSWDTVIICSGLIYYGVNPWMDNTEPYPWQAIMKNNTTFRFLHLLRSTVRCVVLLCVCVICLCKFWFLRFFVVSYEAHVVYLWRLVVLDVLSFCCLIQWIGMIDLWESSGKDSMTWHFIHMWCSNMTNFQTLPGPASEIFSKDFSSTKNTLFFGGRWSSQPPGNFLHSCGGRSSWWETPQAFHAKKVLHKMKNQNISYTFLRWWFHIFTINFHPRSHGEFRWWSNLTNYCAYLHIYLSLGVLKWFNHQLLGCPWKLATS